jgi:hypothetical protein
MKPDFYLLQVRVYVSEMMEFFKDDPEYGTKEKPYLADSFSQIICPYALFYGPLRNILVFRENGIYQWELEAVDGRPLTFSKTSDTPEMEMVMITNKPSDKKWKKVFKDAPDMQADGKIRVKSKNTDKNVFKLETSDDVTDGGRIKYSFLFEFDHNGEVKYGFIDPHGDFYPPPPPAPPIG